MNCHTITKIGAAQAFFLAGLGIHNGFDLFLGAVVSAHYPRYLHGFRDIHHQYPLHQPVLAGFYQQGRSQQAIVADGIL